VSHSHSPDGGMFCDFLFTELIRWTQAASGAVGRASVGPASSFNSKLNMKDVILHTVARWGTHLLFLGMELPSGYITEGSSLLCLEGEIGLL